jgi:hypothetical protein
MDSESKAGLAIFGLWLFWLLVVLAAHVAVIWVIIHFVAKYW